MGEQAAHAKFSASGHYRWGSCFASVPMTAGLESPDSWYAAEGTAAHQVASWVLEEQFREGGNLLYSAEAYRGRIIKVGDFEFEVGDEMIEAVDDYALAVGIFTNAPGTVRMVEQRVRYHTYFGVPEGEAFGTSDVVSLEFDLAEGDCIHVDDLKYGQGVKVYAENNPQMMDYALGALYEFGHLGNFERVKMRIHQPRLNHTDEWECSVKDLMIHAEKTRTITIPCVRKAERIWGSSMLAPTDPQDELMAAGMFMPSEKACQFCDARGHCKAFAQTTLDIVVGEPTPLSAFEDLSADKVLGTIAQRDSDWLSWAMSNVGMIEHWTKGIRAEIERRLLAGQQVPGYELVVGKQGNRKWTDAAAVEAKLKAARLNKEEMYDHKLISPTTAEKRLKKEKPKVWKSLQDMIERPPGRPSVAPVGTGRQQVEVKQLVYEDLSTTAEERELSGDVLAARVHPFRD